MMWLNLCPLLITWLYFDIELKDDRVNMSIVLRLNDPWFGIESTEPFLTILSHFFALGVHPRWLANRYCSYIPFSIKNVFARLPTKIDLRRGECPLFIVSCSFLNLNNILIRTVYLICLGLRGGGLMVWMSPLEQSEHQQFHLVSYLIWSYPRYKKNPKKWRMQYFKQILNAMAKCLDQPMLCNRLYMHILGGSSFLKSN